MYISRFQNTENAKKNYQLLANTYLQNQCLIVNLVSIVEDKI